LYLKLTLYFIIKNHIYPPPYTVLLLYFSSRSFPQNPTISPPSIPAWQLETEETELGPDLVADTIDNAVELEEKEENQSASLSNTSEIEMINPDSQENSSEDGH